MEVRFTCAQGHSWNALLDGSCGDSPVATNCPVCGTAVERTNHPSAGQSLAPDQLPPPPRSEVVTEIPPRAEGAKAMGEHAPDTGLPAGYDILEELGRGGMGVVYKARQRSLNRIVAMKALLAGSQAAPEEVRRFRQEAEALARLQHPHIVQVYDIVEQDGRLCIILEYVEGGSLARKLAGKPTPPLEASRLVTTLARAMHVAHERGIIHRDLKPANVLLGGDASPKITDFGLAKLLSAPTGSGPDRMNAVTGEPAPPTVSGAILGTPSYMAPEQAEGRNQSIGPATDIYALGTILYELLTGRPPFRSGTPFQTLLQVVSEEPKPPSRAAQGVPQELEAICLKCLRKEPAQRYASALELSEALVKFIEHPPAHSTGREPVSSVGMPSSRRVPRKGIAIAGTLILIVAGLWHFLSNQPSWEVFAITSPGEKFDRLAFPTREVGYATSREAIFKTADAGKTWIRLPGFSPGRVHCLYFQDAQTGWLGADRLYETRNGGQTWVSLTLGSGEDLATVSALAFGPEGWALAGGTRRGDRALRFFQRRTSKAGWEELDPEKTGYWGGPQQAYRTWYVGGIGIRGPGQAAVALFKGSEDGGALLMTADGGATWAPVFTTATDLYRVHFTDAQRGWLAGNHGLLWMTRDGGKTWQPHANPGKATISSFAFDSGGRFGVAPLWHGKVLTTTDGSWRLEDVQLGESMPGAAVVDPGCAYVLGADGRIARFVR